VAKNFSNLRETQKQAVKAGKRTRDPENLPSLERPRKRSRTQDLLQTKPRKQVEKQKRPREEDTPVYRSDEPSPKEARKLSESEQSHISHWATKKTWPEAYFKDDKMHHLLAKKGSAATLGRKRSNLSLASFNASDERPREEKSALYRNLSYPTFLFEDVVNYKSYMEDHDLGLLDTSEKLLNKLLHGI
jgi:hypothetical protein